MCYVSSWLLLPAWRRISKMKFVEKSRSLLKLGLFITNFSFFRKQHPVRLTRDVQQWLKVLLISKTHIWNLLALENNYSMHFSKILKMGSIIFDINIDLIISIRISNMNYLKNICWLKMKIILRFFLKDHLSMGQNADFIVNRKL